MAHDTPSKISRRRVLGGSAAALAAPMLCRAAGAQSQTLFVNTWGGSWTAAQEAAYFKPFTEATGIRIRAIAPVSYAKLKAQVVTRSYQWDVTSIEQGELRRADKEGLLEPIDWRIVQKDKLFAGADYSNGISACALGTNLAYRADKFPNGGPKSWADFWDVEKFPGPRAMINNPVRALVFALVADGVPVDQVFPLDVDRAFRKLDRIKPHIKVWWTQGNQSQQLLRDGEVDMMAMWNARASELKQQGVPVEVVWNGAVRSTSTWGVIKGAPNRKLAWELIAFASQAEPQAAFNRRLFYGPIHPGAYAFIPKEVAVQLPTYRDNEAISVREDDQWEADRIAKIEERFMQWLGS